MGVRQVARWWWEGWVRYAAATYVPRPRRREAVTQPAAPVGGQAGEAAKVLLAFAAIYVIWGSTYYAIGETVATVPPVLMVIVRGMLAGGVLYVWSRARGGEPIRARELVDAAPIAALLFGGGYVLVGWAEQRIPTGTAALLNASSPAFVVLIEWVKGLRGRPGKGMVAGLASGVIGVALLVASSGRSGGPPIDLIAAAALVLASVAWAFGSVLAGRRRSGEPVRNAAIQLLTGALILLPVSVASGEWKAVVAGTITVQSLGALAYLVVFGSLIGFTAYVWLLQRVPAAKVASHSYVNPLIAVLVGAGLGGERLDLATIAAAGLIVFSVVTIVTSRNAPEQKQESTVRTPARRGFRRLVTDLALRMLA